MNLPRKKTEKRKGSVLALAVILMVILTLAGFAMLTAAEGRLGQAVRTKSQESAAAAAEAAYEKAVFWMSQQVDLLTSLQNSSPTGTLNFAQSDADYTVTLASFSGSRPIYKVSANGHCGIYQKTLDAYVVQAMAGWEMGQCRIPSSPTSTSEVSFMSGEIIDMPLSINDLKDNPDNRDIYISGTPDFRDHVSMGESRYTPFDVDKYGSTIINMFDEGVSFGQPASRIYDASAVSSKVELFRTTTNSTYRFTPTHISLPKDNTTPKGITGFYSTVSDLPAVQLKFHVKSNGQGYVRIYNNCTVAGYTRGGSSSTTWDYKIDPGGNGSTFIKYPTYGCHYTTGTYTDVRIDNESDPIYVRQNYNGVQSDPGAQIYIDGNVVIGCSSEDAASLGTINTVKGRIAVVATGNIWIANELKVAGTRDASGMPAANNTNVIGLITEGVVKVVDSGMTTNSLLYDNSSTQFNPTTPSNYSPIGIREGSKTYDRQTPYQMVVEAAMTIGGGGWGAENVDRSSTSPRETYNSNQNDILTVRGSITEVCRGIVGSGSNGYLKQYFYDHRLLTGIIPGNIGLKGKYLLVPGGWGESASFASQ
jgi:Tfp pilus assembly protein PilX